MTSGSPPTSEQALFAAPPKKNARCDLPRNIPEMEDGHRRQVKIIQLLGQLRRVDSQQMNGTVSIQS